MKGGNAPHDGANSMNSFRRLLHPHAPKRILEQIDADPAGPPVQHQNHGAVYRIEYRRQRSQTFSRIGQMVQDSGGQDEMKALTEVTDFSQIHDMQCEICEIVTRPQPFLMHDAGLREVDARDGTFGIQEGDHCALHRPATRYKDVESLFWASLGPKQWRIGARVVEIIIVSTQPCRDVVANFR